MAFHLHLSKVYGVGLNLLMASQADEELPTTNAQLEVELRPQETVIKSPEEYSSLPCRSKVQPQIAQAAPSSPKLLLLYSEEEKGHSSHLKKNERGGRTPESSDFD